MQSPMAADAVGDGRAARAGQRAREAKKGGAAGWFLFTLKAGLLLLSF